MPQKTQEPKARASKRSERKRFLNVIYFVDSKRTRTLKFSIRHAFVTVACLAAIVVWSFCATILLVRESLVSYQLKDQSRQLLAVIFDYQTRYDQVYERAYPEPSLLSTNETEEADASSDPDPPAPSPSRRSAASLKQAEVAAPGTASGDAPPDRVAEPQPKARPVAQGLAKSLDDVPIAVENFSTAFQDEILTVRFSLRNLARPNRTSGVVTASAKFIDEQKRVRTVAMRVEPGSGESGSESADPTSDQHFNIRYYKNKVFHFDIPRLQSGRVTDVTIAIQDTKGRARDFFFPLNTESASAPGATESELSRPYARSVPQAP